MLASGGVCAVLDYELDQMVEYVTEMATRLVSPNSSTVSPAFRKFVSQLLSSTRLPSTTILLGMNYLARRVNVMMALGGPQRKVHDADVWRMLTIGLLLGSKFLDDNTFQNRSWSEVSGIPVSELNTMEQAWLESMDWNIYVNLDHSGDYNAWLQSWKDWVQDKNRQRKATLDRLAPLAPIDTNVQRPRPYQQQSYNTYTKAPAREPQPTYHSAYDQNSWNSYPTPQLTPPSAPDSTLTTPEYMSATGGAPRYNDWTLFTQYSVAHHQAQAHAPYIPSHPHPAVYNTPYTPYGYHYGGHPWDHSASDCNCGNGGSCNIHGKPYFMNHGHAYGQQIVAG